MKKKILLPFICESNRAVIRSCIDNGRKAEDRQIVCDYRWMQKMYEAYNHLFGTLIEGNGWNDEITPEVSGEYIVVTKSLTKSYGLPRSYSTASMWDENTKVWVKDSKLIHVDYWLPFPDCPTSQFIQYPFANTYLIDQ